MEATTTTSTAPTLPSAASPSPSKVGNRDNDGANFSTRKLFVENIEWSVHENALKHFASHYGQVKKCTIVRDAYTNRSRGFGFVEFYSDEDARQLLNAKRGELLLNGRHVKVDYYRYSAAKSTAAASAASPPSTKPSLEYRHSAAPNRDNAKSQIESCNWTTPCASSTIQDASTQEPSPKPTQLELATIPEPATELARAADPPTPTNDCVAMHEKADSSNPNQLQDQQEQQPLDTEAANSKSNSSSISMRTSPATIEQMPYNVLLNVFSNLCLRDLCIAEQVCKHWYSVAYMVWASKKRLIVTHANTFDKFVKKPNNIYGFVPRPTFNLKALKQLLHKGIGANLTHLDLSEYAQSFDSKNAPHLIASECPNLTHLNLTKMNILNTSINRLARHCQHLKEVVLANCTQITDSGLERLIGQCKQLDSLDITNCQRVIGKCFRHSSNRLTTLIIDQCDSLNDEYLRYMFSHNTNFVHLSMRRSNRFSPLTLTTIINKMHRLVTLNLADSGFDSLSTDEENMASVKFQSMCCLANLDISNSNGDNRLITLLLANSSSLSNLNLSYCYKIVDEPFTNARIRAPLRELNLNFVKQLTDAALDALVQCAATLAVLKIKGCTQITSDGVCRALDNLTKLSKLDVRTNYQMDIRILDKALSMSAPHPIKILCNDTNVDTVMFMYKHEETVKEAIDRNCFSFKYKHLTFESSTFEANKFRKNSEHVKIWEEDGLFYIGSPLASSDEDLDGWNLGGGGGDARYDDEQSNGSEEDFMNGVEPQEMLNELDEY